MKIFKVWQEENNNYDTYDSFVVVTTDAARAKDIRPSWQNNSGIETVNWDNPDLQNKDIHCLWARHRYAVYVEYLGESDSEVEQIVCASFNAG